MKLDLKKTYKEYFNATKTPTIVKLDTYQYISIIGKGDPDSENFKETVQALYTLAYFIKFSCKQKKKTLLYLV